MEMFISQQPKAIESRNWCQMIALTIFYNRIIRYINKLTFLLLKYLRKWYFVGFSVYLGLEVFEFSLSE